MSSGSGFAPGTSLASSMDVTCVGAVQAKEIPRSSSAEYQVSTVVVVPLDSCRRQVAVGGGTPTCSVPGFCPTLGLCFAGIFPVVSLEIDQSLVFSLSNSCPHKSNE